MAPPHPIQHQLGFRASPNFPPQACWHPKIAAIDLLRLTPREVTRCAAKGLGFSSGLRPRAAQALRKCSSQALGRAVLGLVQACANAQPRHCENFRSRRLPDASFGIWAPASRNAMLVSTRHCLILLGQTVLGLVQACANAQPRHRQNFRSCYFPASAWRPPHHHPTASDDTWGEAF